MVSRIGIVNEFYELFLLRQGVVYVLNGVCRIFGKNPMSDYFLNLVNLIGGIVYHFSNGLGCHMPCESLDGLWETETHSKARGIFHMSTFRVEAWHITYATQAYHTHFRSPWTFLAFVGTIITLFLSALQTYYTIHPKKWDFVFNYLLANLVTCFPFYIFIYIKNIKFLGGLLFRNKSINFKR